MDIIGNVRVIITHASGQADIYHATNLVTNEGDDYYAQKAAGEAPTHDFSSGGIRLGTNFVSADKDDIDVDNEHSNGRLDVDATYPKTDDSDTDNLYPGENTISWRFSYSLAEGNITGIEELAIVDDKVTPTAALCHAKFDTQFTKTASDTMKIFVNHKFVGG